MTATADEDKKLQFVVLAEGSRGGSQTVYGPTLGVINGRILPMEALVSYRWANIDNNKSRELIRAEFKLGLSPHDSSTLSISPLAKYTKYFEYGSEYEIGLSLSKVLIKRNKYDICAGIELSNIVVDAGQQNRMGDLFIMGGLELNVSNTILLIDFTFKNQMEAEHNYSITLQRKFKYNAFNHIGLGVSIDRHGELKISLLTIL